MKYLSRDSWLAIGLFLILLLVTIAAAIQQTQEESAPPLASFSSAPSGAKALRLWLEELDYSLNDEPLASFQLPSEASLIFMLEPFPDITENEWQIIDNWINKGGTLMVAGDGFGSRQAMRHYDVSLNYMINPTTVLTAETPLLASPPIETVTVKTRAYLTTQRNDFVTHLSAANNPLLLSFKKGEGQVILSATPFPFSNIGLKEAGNPTLVLNLITMTKPSGLVWFDEWHHGQRLDRVQVVGPWDWLRYTPAGRSLLFVGAVIFIGLVLQGRRFGRSVPLPKDISRRGPLEYITAIANLNRRAGHREAVLRQYRDWLKRGLGQRYRLNPTLPDDQYVKTLAQFNPYLDTEALGKLLTRLNRAQVSESEMIQLAAEVAHWLKET